MPFRSHLRLAAVPLIVAVAVACGGGDDETPTATATLTTPSPTATARIAGPPPSTPTAAPTAAATPETYVVVAGDTLYDIANRFGTTVEAIVAANGIVDPSQIQIGQVLVIPPSES